MVVFSKKVCKACFLNAEGEELNMAYLFLCRGGQLDAQLCAPRFGAVSVSFHVLPRHKALTFRLLPSNEVVAL